MPVEVKGEAQLQASMSRAWAAIPRLDGSKQAGLVATAARSFAPRRTGRLASSISPQRRPGGGGRAVVSAPYAGYVEYGTRHMRGRHYLKRAVEARTPDVVDAYEKQVQAELNKVRGA